MDLRKVTSNLNDLYYAVCYFCTKHILYCRKNFNFTSANFELDLESVRTHVLNSLIARTMGHIDYCFSQYRNQGQTSDNHKNDK